MTTRTALLAGSAARAIPRAVLGSRLHAAITHEQAVAHLQSQVEQWQTQQVRRIDAIEANMGTDANRAAAALLGIGGGGPPADPAYNELFASFARRGEGENELRQKNAIGDRAAIKAAMTEGSSGNGGLLAPVEWDRKVAQKQRIFSPMRRLATVIQTTVQGYSTVWSDGGWGSGWVGETAARPATATPNLSTIPFSAGQLYAMPNITQDLLDDAQFNVDEWLQNEVAETFALNEGIAFDAGDGVNKPRGFLQYTPGGAFDAAGANGHPGGNLAVIPSGSAAALTADALVSFVYQLKAPYRQGAAWLMSSTTAAAIALMKNGQGQYIWSQSLAEAAPPTLLGYPVEIDENMPGIAAGTLPIAFGNWRRGYVINDRQGVSLLRDPYTNKPFVQFYVRKRVGGGVWDPNAIQLLKIAAS